jgi:hypothetical protein
MDNFGDDICERTGHKLRNIYSIPPECPLERYEYPEKKIKLLREGLLSARRLLEIAFTRGPYPQNMLDRYNKAISRLIRERMVKK